jgi:hypothetical protein
MNKLTTAQQAVIYVTNKSKTITATYSGDKVIINTELGKLTLSHTDTKRLADEWKHENAWYANMPLEQLAKVCHEELGFYLRTGDKTYLGNAEEGLEYLAEMLQRESALKTKITIIV